ncbi:cysteine peptidase family C39 domain-containing protein [Limnobaculum xujianqingii]|uniref:cysteine peptidase family C39 domain-containing protein n=1 Tax=Limnobaculum xujianqingii TaxID=2738837 RepID=UPI0015B87428|nr:cysteine peptidase family C39 domain-containing protein [Limnobaculum xujianqingii]
MSQDFAPATDAQQDSLLWSVQWLAAYYNKPASAAVLYAGLPKEPKLTSQLALRMLDQIGMGVAWVERDLDQLFSYLFPVVLTRKDGSHCIVTERSSGKGAGSSYRVILPENGGEVTLSARALEEMYSGYALLCNPKPKLDERSNDCLPEPNKEGHWLFSTLWRYRHYFASAAMAALLANILTLASTFFTMNVYDRVVPTQAYVTLWSLGIGVFIAIIFEFVSRLVRAHLFDIAGKKADLLLGTMLFRQVLGIRMESKPQSSGAFANQLREFESVRDFVTSATLSTLSDLPFCALFLFIIYLEDQLLVEAKIKPSDVAFLHPGLKATVKITAYDYAIYGGLSGTLEHISADTLKDEDKMRQGRGDTTYYRVLVRTDKAALTAKDKVFPIMPGMIATVEIRTGEKTILDYILKPVLKAREAFRER